MSKKKRDRDVEPRIAEAEAAVAVPGAAPGSNPPAKAALINGEYLRGVRESKGLTLKEIADRTKVGASSLAAVEEERFEDLPEARIYVRGFVRCLAQELGLDPDAVGAAYLPRWERWFENQNFPKKKLLRGRG